jgi:hypothetical protein
VDRITEEIGGNNAVRDKPGLEHFASFGNWR